MVKRELMTVAKWTAGTFLLTAALLLPGRLQADGPAGAKTPPVLRSGGAECFVRLENGKADGGNGAWKLEPGVRPMVTLVVRNTAARSIEVHPTLDITATSPRELMSRTPVIPRSIWTRDNSLVLAPGAEQTLKFEVDAKIEAGSTMTVQLRQEKDAIAALSFYVPGEQRLSVILPAGQ